jgi:hypothetical protein
MQLTKAVREYILGSLLPDDLPAIAVRAIEDGYDSPALYELAGADGADTQHLRTLFCKAMDQLGITLPSPAQAGLAAALSIAEDILRGCIAPYEGAKQIWDKVYTRFPELTQLRTFVGLASEYEDDEGHRPQYARDIIEECRDIVMRSGQGEK